QQDRLAPELRGRRALPGDRGRGGRRRLRAQGRARQPGARPDEGDQRRLLRRVLPGRRLAAVGQPVLQEDPGLHRRCRRRGYRCVRGLRRGDPAAQRRRRRGPRPGTGLDAEAVVSAGCPRQPAVLGQPRLDRQRVEAAVPRGRVQPAAPVRPGRQRLAGLGGREAFDALGRQLPQQLPRLAGGTGRPRLRPLRRRPLPARPDREVPAEPEHPAVLQCHQPQRPSAVRLARPAPLQQPVRELRPDPRARRSGQLLTRPHPPAPSSPRTRGSTPRTPHTPKRGLYLTSRFSLLPLAAALALMLGACGGDAAPASEAGTPTTGAATSAAGAGAAQATSTHPALAEVPVIPEAFKSAMTPEDNIDSVASWTHADGRTWVFATAKSTDRLVVYDGDTGETLRTLGERGEGDGQFKRPNGVFVIADVLLVVERDNRRVQGFALPSLEPLGHFGTDELVKPYGLWVDKADGGYQLYVTDAYMAGEDAEGED